MTDLHPDLLALFSEDERPIVVELAHLAETALTITDDEVGFLVARDDLRRYLEPAHVLRLIQVIDLQRLAGERVLDVALRAADVEEILREAADAGKLELNVPGHVAIAFQRLMADFGQALAGIADLLLKDQPPDDEPRIARLH